MLRNRIDVSKSIPTEVERAELMRLGALLDHDIADAMLVVKPGTYRDWLRKKRAEKKADAQGRPPP